MKYLLLLFLLLKSLFSIYTNDFLPNLAIIPPVPNQSTIKSLSLGDEEFIFRSLVFRIQNAGDTFNRFTSLQKYDYDHLIKWFKLLDNINFQSTSIPALAIHYYAATQKKDDIRKIIDYILSRTGNIYDDNTYIYIDKTINNSKWYEINWWWITRCVTLAQHRLNDLDLALDISKNISSNYNQSMPYWVKQLPAFIYEIRGENQQAYFIMKELLETDRNISAAEQEFMEVFIKERTKDL